ncbi:MAG: MarR family transcriptional regulator [Clostridium sp.]|nr:MarR family transcriptional regulator [Clostridium sp.]
MDPKRKVYIGHSIKKVSRSMNNVYDEKLNEYGVTASQVSILYVLWNKDGLSQKEIQGNLNLRPASVSGLVDVLCAKNLITRELDREDARIKRLHLTEKGKKLEEISIKIIGEIENILLDGFSEDEQVILNSWMIKIYKNIVSEEKYK